MNLIIDIGNTSTKLAIYDKGKRVHTGRIDDLTGEVLEKELAGFGIDKAIISSGRKITQKMIQLFSANIKYVHILTYKSKLPFRIEYETPATLGPDRIAGVAGAYNLFPHSEILIIDAGTAITYDYLSGGIYKGGNISPGMNIRFRALNEFTGKLPLVKPDRNYTNPGRNTADAILAGVITGVTYEINEYIRTFEKKSTDFKILFTGGDSGFLKEKINYQFTYMPDIVIDGLNYILEYNAA
jgi:type III pantothenate kinase